MLEFYSVLLPQEKAIHLIQAAEIITSFGKTLNKVCENLLTQSLVLNQLSNFWFLVAENRKPKADL